MSELSSSEGGDATKAIVTYLEDNKDEITRDAIDLWFQESTDWLTEAAERRAQLGQRHGRQGRADTGLSQIAQKAVPPFWDDQREAWVFSFPHAGAVFQEYGAMPHEIRARRAEVLAFEWPDAPAEVQEQFDHTEGDLVFFESINHPGIPSIGFVRYGRERARVYLQQAGYTVTEFSE
jgi:hypothetical protein